MKEIRLTQGRVALVDDEDFDALNKFKWCVSSGYVVSGTKKVNGKQCHVKMHRVIMDTPKGMHTDHKDNNKLNNQKSNLRVCTHRENCMNRKKRKQRNISSSFKGVSVKNCFSKDKSKSWLSYCVQVSANTKRISQNFPFTPEGEIEAAKFYNELARKHYGEFAQINLIP